MLRTAITYFLKKMHKNPMSIRPIVSTTNSATANLAEFLDFYLQPIMKQLPAYLKDTTQFIQEITDLSIHNNTWLVTVDVKSLYTNIPNEQGIQACYQAWLEQETKDSQQPPAETLKQLLELVLSSTYSSSTTNTTHNYSAQPWAHNFSKMLLQHKRNLIRRSYSNAVINRQLRSIKFSMRAKLLKKKKQMNNQQQQQRHQQL